MTTAQAMLIGAALAWGPSLLVFAWIVMDMRNTHRGNNSSGLCSLLASVSGKAQLFLTAFPARVDFLHSAIVNWTTKRFCGPR